jgi:glycosyltransferase involved in cell wall biosynthesis
MTAQHFLQIPLLKLSAHGGVRVLVDLANRAAANGWRVRLLVPRGFCEKRYDFQPGVEVREIGPSIGHKFIAYFLFLLISPFYMRDGILCANFYVTFFPVMAAHRLFARPYFYLVQDIETWGRGPFGPLLNMACRLTWQSQRMVTTSPRIARELQSFGHAPWREVMLGVSPEFLKPVAQPVEKKYDVICFPRPEPWKRLDRIQKVLQRYREAYGALSVLCVGQDVGTLETCRGWGCEILSPASDQELIDAVDRSRLMLATSEKEGLGLPPLEAMARGVPPVIYQCEGSSCYMRDGENGFVIPHDDDQQAVERVHQLLSDAPLYGRMQQAIRVHLPDPQFALDKIIDAATAA